jgi:hypothetical protein
MGGKINKSKLNLSIDIIMFVALMAIAGIGFLIKYVLIPGFKRNLIYGKDVELFYWGLDRHQWGTIHLIISFVLLFLLVLHIIFHWKQIVSIFKRMIPVKHARYFLASSFIFLSLLLGLAPLFVKPQIEEQASHHYNQEADFERNQQNINSAVVIDSSGLYPNQEGTVIKNHEGKHNQWKDKEIEVYGYMTLQQVSSRYKISVAELASVIHVPQESSNEKLGRLRKRYAFHMDDLRDYIGTRKEE